MGRLSVEDRKARRFRMRDERAEATRAPHRALVETLLRTHAPPLQQKVRGRVIDELAIRVLMLESSPEPLVSAGETEQLVLLLSRVVQVVSELSNEQRVVRRRLLNFTQLYARLDDERARRDLIADYLTETAADRRTLAADLAAVERALDADAIRERAAAELHSLGNIIEVAVGFGGQAAVVVAAAAEGPAAAEAALRDVGAVAMLIDWAEEGERFTTRLAALDGLLGLSERAPGCLDRVVRTRIGAVADNRDLHAWVQARALEVTLVGAAGQPGARAAGQAGEGSPVEQSALDRLEKRLFDVREGATEMYVRGLACGAAIRRLPPRAAAALLINVLDDDPSEFVRCEAVRAAGGLPADIAFDVIVDGVSTAEPSARVRARAVEAAVAAARAHGGIERAGELVTGAMSDDDPLVLVTACEEIEVLARLDAGALSSQRAAWLRSLERLRSRDDVSPAVVERAAAAAEAIEHCVDERRAALVEWLERASAAVPVGGARSVALASLADDVAALCRSPADLGRALSLVARNGWGLTARLVGERLTLWRGDAYRRRAWRILHEFRNRAPNKRQGHPHTVGRRLRGDIRAHPQLLDEATATTVPGERVHVDGEGDWGRQLPTVDDLLDMPVWRERPVRVFSSHGVTRLEAPPTVRARLRNWWRVTTGYARLAARRQSSLAADEPRERAGYAVELAHKLDVRMVFEPHDYGGEPGPVADHVRALFPSDPKSRALGLGAFALPGSLEPLRDWFSVNSYYFSSLQENSQEALALFAGVGAALFLGRGYSVRRSLERKRASIPLSVGGWGTRGKSGTERLKAGLFGGLGFDVFVKTTGCEAMFLHAAAGQAPVEIFIYRPYDKATIWEQYDMIDLASRLRADVFLWECMALNPRYVRLLQHDWMRDDLVTLTNAYPDHEDVQGPAGIDVARTISEFIPPRSTLVTSEINFLPLFEQVCRERDTAILAVEDRQAALICDDVLDTFPYREHPRNIALVATMAEQLGMEPMLAIATMAEAVVPDLGVLKEYPTATFRGRKLRFINCCSANERTGLVNSWQRMGLHQLDPAEQPGEMIIGVVNNRADRISRSEVFARIMVQDVAVDRFVLIGTNLEGLKGYLEAALDDHLRGLAVVAAEDLTDPGGRALAEARVARELARLRTPPGTVDAAMARLRLYAQSAGFDPAGEFSAVQDRVETILENGSDVDVDAVRASLERDKELRAAVEDALAEHAPVDTPTALDSIETVEPATREDVVERWLDELSRSCVRATIDRELDELLAAGSDAGVGAFNQRMTEAYRSLFWANIVEVEDAGASGDQITDRCARLAPPGARVALVGMQNIKGTGLDFVYRWIALDTVVNALEQLEHRRSDRRQSALDSLEGFGDYGLIDSGLAHAVLAADPQRTIGAAEQGRRDVVRHRLDELWRERLDRLARTATTGRRMTRIAGLIEGAIDYIDSVRRYRASKRVSRDLVAGRISHARAQREMRALVARQKGGWLAKRLSGS